MRLRWGLGPDVDPHFDARAGQSAVRAAAAAGEAAPTPGYIEFVGTSAVAYLEALFEVLYGQAPRGSGSLYRMSGKLSLHRRPLVWTQLGALQYLTTDVVTGVALPLHDFNPDRDAADWPAQAPQRLQQAIDRLHAATGGKLKSARTIGLTVTFRFDAGAAALQAALRPSRLPRWLGGGWPRGRIRRTLFGGGSFGPLSALLGRSVGARCFDAQRIGIAGGCSAQLQRAMRDLEFDEPDPGPQAPTDELTYGLAETGHGTIVGIVDFGCDFAHPSFCDPKKPQRSRILALWDQNDAPEQALAPAALAAPAEPAVSVEGQELRFGYGRMFTRAQIDTALRDWHQQHPANPEAPYGLLGYDPHDHHYTSKRPGAAGGPLGAHGTMVMDIAAGGRRDALGPPGIRDRPQVRGVASQSDIVFVQVRLHHPGDGRKVLELNDVVDAVAFVFHVAEREGRPCVVNLSLNTQSGPHDGDGHFERRIAALLRSGSAGAQGRGRSVVIAAGNLADRAHWQHLADAVNPGARFAFRWRIEAGDRTRNSIEIWYDADQAWLQASLVSPEGTELGPVAPGQAAEIVIDGKPRGTLIGSRLMPAAHAGGAHDDAQLPASDTAPGRHVILIEIDPEFAVETSWEIVLEAVDGTHAPASAGPAIAFHAWLERDDNGQSGLCRSKACDAILDRDERSTIGTLSCGPDTFVVGAYSTTARKADNWGPSARGPSRKGDIEKPDLIAPGQTIWFIRSKKAGDPAPGTRDSGTSLAAPFVTGTIACIYEASPNATLDDVRDALVSTTRPPPGVAAAQWTREWKPLSGYGRLNPAAAVQRIRATAAAAAGTVAAPATAVTP